MDGININSIEKPYAYLIATGEKTIETRGRNTLKSQIGKRVYIIETGTGEAKAIGEVTIGKPIIYRNEKEFISEIKKHMVIKGSKYWIRPDGIKYGYPMIDPAIYETPFSVKEYGIVIRKNVTK